MGARPLKPGPRRDEDKKRSKVFGFSDAPRGQLGLAIPSRPNRERKPFRLGRPCGAQDLRYLAHRVLPGGQSDDDKQAALSLQFEQK
jgi:hypothetical protein